MELTSRFPPICQGGEIPRDTDVERVLASHRVSAKTSCEIIAELGRRREVSKAMAVYAYLLAQEPSEQPNLYHYNALIAACQRESRWSTALRLFSEMRARGITPDRITYTSLIAACGRGRRWDVALDVLADMKLNGVPRSIITYNAVLSSCEKAGRLEEALHLMKELEEEEPRIVPDLITFSALISTCEKLGDWKRAWEFMRAATSAGLQADVIAYNSLISACDKGLQPSEAQAVYEEMCARGPAPDSITYCSLISAYASVGDAEGARQVFDRMLEREQGSIQTAAMFHELMRSCQADGLVKEATEYLQMLQDRGFQATAFTFALMAAVCDSAERPDLAQEYTNMMRLQDSQKF
eukprot:Tamp_14389.p1 GENE.Tamp_14389~~Tamp_14389.p1  ORF type:complete len:354 (+),score=64.45 Tamp_14389:492-1553(+)